MSSKEVAQILAMLKIAYPNYFKDYKQEETHATINLYKQQLSIYNFEIVSVAINNLIKKSKFLPAISEIIEECEKLKGKHIFSIIGKMNNDGYFKSITEYEKAVKFLETGIIPSWFKEDMKKYGYVEINNIANSSSALLLNGVVV